MIPSACATGAVMRPSRQARLPARGAEGDRRRAAYWDPRAAGRGAGHPGRDTRLPLIQPKVQRCPSCKSQTPDNGRNFSRLECGSAATSSPTIRIAPSVAEPRRRRDRAGATGTGGSSTCRRNPSEFGVTHWRRRQAVRHEPSETWPGHVRSPLCAHPGTAFPFRNSLREGVPADRAPPHPVRVIGRAQRPCRREPPGRSGCRPV
jgi:hypothetical protein